jgi:hypothetical protein
MIVLTHPEFELGLPFEDAEHHRIARREPGLLRPCEDCITGMWPAVGRHAGQRHDKESCGQAQASGDRTQGKEAPNNALHLVCAGTCTGRSDEVKMLSLCDRLKKRKGRSLTAAKFEVPSLHRARRRARRRPAWQARICQSQREGLSAIPLLQCRRRQQGGFPR